MHEKVLYCVYGYVPLHVYMEGYKKKILSMLVTVIQSISLKELSCKSLVLRSISLRKLSAL